MDVFNQTFPFDLSETDIGNLQAAVENLRSPDRMEARTIDAAFRIAETLEALARRAERARREQSAKTS